ncbi:hypothetical protein CHU98_g11968 [Xylaria longipes]|nr:hypothetical protein CHU98_g11968 [Xylaria longipes]
MSPTPRLTPSRSVMTKLTALLRNTRNEMLKREMPSRYVAAWRGVVEGLKGSSRDVIGPGLRVGAMDREIKMQRSVGLARAFNGCSERTGST